MNRNRKKIAVIVALVLCIGGLIWLLFFAGSRAYVAPAERQTHAVQAEAQFYITVVDEVVDTEAVITRDDAQIRCDSIAFNPDYMFKQVTCVYDGEEFYNDIFVAG